MVKELEIRVGRLRPPWSHFLRKGEKGQWRAGLNRDTLDYIEAEGGSVMERFGMVAKGLSVDPRAHAIPEAGGV